MGGLHSIYSFQILGEPKKLNFISNQRKSFNIINIHDKSVLLLCSSLPINTITLEKNPTIPTKYKPIPSTKSDSFAEANSNPDYSFILLSLWRKMHLQAQYGQLSRNGRSSVHKKLSPMLVKRRSRYRGERARERERERERERSCHERPISFH